MRSRGLGPQCRESLPWALETPQSWAKATLHTICPAWHRGGHGGQSVGVSKAQWNHCRECCGDMRLKEGMWSWWFRIHRLQEHRTPNRVPVTHPLNGERKPPKSPQALAIGIREVFSYLSAEQAAKAGGAGCAPRGQGEESVAAPGRGGCG